MRTETTVEPSRDKVSDLCAAFDLLAKTESRRDSAGILTALLLVLCLSFAPSVVSDFVGTSASRPSWSELTIATIAGVFGYNILIFDRSWLMRATAFCLITIHLSTVYESLKPNTYNSSSALVLGSLLVSFVCLGLARRSSVRTFNNTAQDVLRRIRL